MFYLESTEVFVKEVRCFQFPKCLEEAAPVLFSKKVFEKSPTFPTPTLESSFIHWGFRVKDRV